MADSFTPEQIENMNRFFELINSSLSPLNELQQEELAAAQATRNHRITMNNLSNEIDKTLKGSLVSLYNGAKSAETGLSKYSDTVTGVTNALGNFGIQMGGAAKAAGYFVKALGSVTEAAFQQNDALMAAYESLSELGSVTQSGLGGLADQLHDVGLASYEFQKFVDVLRPVAGTLSSFGGSLSAGRDALSNVLSEFVGVDNELELSLNRIGYSSVAIRDGVADYVQMQTRLGKAQGKSTSDLVNESQKYLIEMRGLQELTGMTRDEQQRARDAMMTDARFSLHLADLKEDEAKNLQNYLIGYQKAFGPEAAQGLKDRIINAGAITTEAAGASFMRGNQEYELAMRAQREGMGVFQDSLVQTAINTKKTIGTFRETFKFAEGGMNSMGLTNQMVNGSLELSNTKSKNYQKTLDGLFVSTKDQSDQTNLLRDQQESQYRREQEARATRLRDDDMLSIVSGGLIGVFDGLTRIVTAFNKMLAQSIDWITSHSGGMMTPTDLSKYYEKGGAGSSGGGSGGTRRGLGPSSNNQVNNPLPTSVTGDESAILDRLNFGGQRAERTGGGTQDPAMLALADRINSQLSGITITAMNDTYHHTAPGRSKSKHRVGKALDFALDHDPDDVEAEEILDLLRQMGGINPINEYTNGRKNGSGGHFHVEVARHGGLFSGRDSGYPVMLHGKNESVWPEKDLTSFMKDVQKTSLEQYKQELMTQILPGATTDSSGSVIADAFSAFNNKLDTLISEQRNSNGIQNEILTYTRA